MYRVCDCEQCYQLYDKCDVYESSDDVEYDVNENECVFEGFDERMS